jgi:hypothetical protein
MDASDDDDGIDGEFYDLFVATDLAGLELAAAYQLWNPVDLDDSVGTWA